MPKDPDEFRMSLGDHLEELRRRIILGLIGVSVGAVICLVFGREIVAWLCVPLTMVLSRLGLPAQVYSFTPMAAFSVYLQVSLIGGVIMSLPWVLWQLWKFIEPGLFPSERKFVYMLVPGSTALVLTGVAFMYYVMLPVTLAFLLSFSVSFPAPQIEAEGYFDWYIGRLVGEARQVDPVENAPELPQYPVLAADPAAPADGAMWIKVPEYQLRVAVKGQIRSMPLLEPGLNAPLMQVNDYVSFVIWLALAFAIAFQLPLVMLLLALTRLVTRQDMAGVRKYALLVAAVIGALLTPADPISMILLAVPMYVLYEFGLLLARVFVRPIVAEEDGFDELF